MAAVARVPGLKPAGCGEGRSLNGTRYDVAVSVMAPSRPSDMCTSSFKRFKQFHYSNQLFNKFFVNF